MAYLRMETILDIKSITRHGATGAVILHMPPDSWKKTSGEVDGVVFNKDIVVKHGGDGKY